MTASCNCAYPKTGHGDLHGIGGGQAGQEAALLGDVLHDHLLPKLRPLAAVPDGDSGAHLACIYCSLCNQQPACTTTATGLKSLQKERYSVVIRCIIKMEVLGFAAVPHGSGHCRFAGHHCPCAIRTCLSLACITVHTIAEKASGH